MPQKSEINTPRRGMNRSAAIYDLKPEEYSVAINMNRRTDTGESSVLTTEQSNLLATKFKEGYKVVGFKNDITTFATYFFLTNPETGVSEFGRIKDNQVLPNLGDTIEESVDCTECDKKVKLSEPLENQNQVATQTYETLLEDSCNKCLNLSIYHPIKTHNIHIKNEKCGNTLYFTDNLNPPRYIQLDNLETYSFIGDINCGTDNTTSTCLACDKLRMFRLYDEAQILPSEIVLGGRLPMGSYEFLIAYCDNFGNELSEYFPITNPIHVFDQNNNILEQSELNSLTNFAIKLDVTGLDTTFNNYKVVVIQTTSLDGAPRYFEEGVHPITDTTVLYTTDKGKLETSINNIFQIRDHITKFKGLSTANNYLFGYGIEREKEWNLQPVVNLMGSFFKWQTHITTEEYYNNGVNSSLGKGYMRDETYPLSIRFGTRTGYKTALFPLISRPSTATDIEAVDNLDTQSIVNGADTCNGSLRTKRWNFYNTATVEGECTLADDVAINTITEPVTKTCIVDSAATTGSGSFTIENVEDFTNLSNLIDEILEKGTCTGYPFCSSLDFETTPDCDPGFDNCDTPVLLNEFFQVNTVGDFTLTEIEKSFPSEYRKTSPLSFCNLYIANQSGGFEVDSETTALLTRGNIYFRDYLFTNDACAYAEELEFLQTGSATENYFHNYIVGDTTEASILTSYESTCTSSLFSNFVHKNALWFEIPLEDKDRFVFEVTKQVDPKGNDGISIDGQQEVRITFFDGCGNTTPLYCKIINLSSGEVWMLDKNQTGTTITFEDEDNVQSAPQTLTTDTLIVAIDNMRQQDSGTNNWFTRPTNGCFSVVIREPEIAQIDVDYDNIVFDKVQKYEADCSFDIPLVDECKLIPHKYGKFAYVESTEDYPDNPELYNSSSLVVNESDFSDLSIATEFETTFADSKDVSGEYTLSSDTNFSCTPIRHFKFPDNKVSPFMYENPQSGFLPSIIYPLGVTVDENLINDFLNIAVNNGLITQEQRSSITSYEIFRGDRTLDKSIVAKGLLYDMYQYTEDRKNILYPNYPYNDLGEDVLNYTDENRSSFIQHPYSGDYNYNFSFLSPETSFLRPTLGSEIKVDGYMFGNSRGSFDEVEEHSKWVILGAEANRLASTLATAEVAAEAALNVAMAYGGNNLFFGGVSTGGTFAGIVFASIAAGFQVASAILYQYGRYKYEWLRTFENLGQPQNFAYYYSSEGYYNYLRPIQETGNELRALNIAEYLRDSRKILVDKINAEKIEINNLRREDSVFIKTGTDYPINYPLEYKDFDNNDLNPSLSSRFNMSQNLQCASGRSVEITRNIASPFVSVKNYIPSQYGTIDSIKWLSTSYKGDLQNPKSDCLAIYGGDVYISRYTAKRKIPMFLRDAFDIASLTPFNYKNYSNIGTEPRFFCNYNTPNEVNIDRGFPNIESEYNFDCLSNSRGFYLEPPTKFYLYYYGIPNFLTETEINLNYRYGKTQPKDNFYPNVGDYMDWTQQKNVPISERNTFYYNFNYSKNVTPSISRILPATFDQEEYDCRLDEENGTVYSLQDNSENDLFDPWLVFRPLDKYNFSSSYGKLIEMRGIENEQVLARFTDATVVFNAVDTTSDDGSRPETQELGTGGVFARRPRTFSNTDLGKWGTQSSEMSSNEFGHFSVDAKRGSITHIMPSSQGVNEISKYDRQGRPNGMYDWFRNHLPFKILDSRITNYENIDTDNPYNGIGITVGYDDRYKRVFFTKKDYVPKQNLYYENNKYYTSQGGTEVQLTDNTYFNDVSWTIAYDVASGDWLSYYDFKPNYYIPHNDYFQTGYNTDTDFGLWSHNLTNKSFRVFQGTAYPSHVTYATKNDPKEINTTAILFKSDTKRYHNEYDYAYERDITWNKAMVWSARENSGNLNLVPQKYLDQIYDYPITKSTTEQDILVTNTEELWSFDYIYNRKKSERNNQPDMIRDINDISKTLNPDAVSFYGKEVLEPMSSTAFNVSLTYDKDTRYEVDLQWTINLENSN